MRPDPRMATITTHPGAEMAGRLATVNSADELEKAYREEATRIRASLAARVGDVGLAEEAVQEAFIEALEHWRGVAPQPSGWVATTARGKGIDRLRRGRGGPDQLAPPRHAEAPRTRREGE